MEIQHSLFFFPKKGENMRLVGIFAVSVVSQDSAVEEVSALQADWFEWHPVLPLPGRFSCSIFQGHLHERDFLESFKEKLADPWN